MSVPLSLGHDRKNRLHSWDKICLAFVFCSLEESLLTTLGKEKCHNIYSQMVKVVLASFYFGKLHVANIKNFPHHFCYKVILHFLLCSGTMLFFFPYFPPMKLLSCREEEAGVISLFWGHFADSELPNLFWVFFKNQHSYDSPCSCVGDIPETSFIGCHKTQGFDIILFL